MARKKSCEARARQRVLDYVNKVEHRCPELSNAGRNLTKMYLEGKLDEVYGRDNIVASMQKILLRKSKANVLLTGPAGCGKTAIAERLAAIFAQRSIEYATKDEMAEDEYQKAYNTWRESVNYDEDDNYTISPPVRADIEMPYQSKIVLFELSLTSLTAGTRYRGDFEERVDNILQECKGNPNIILFIDEIHQITKAGASDSNEGVAQMLKPALARKDICVIGATTTDEAEHIYKDKALARRFNEVKIAPLCGETAIETAKSIMADYCKFHSVKTNFDHASEIVDKLSYFLPKTVFPDNFINVVDETLAGAKFDGLAEVDMTHFNATLSRMAGVVIL